MTLYGSSATAGRRTRDGFGVLALLKIDLAEIDGGARVARIELAHALEEPRGIRFAVVGARDQAEHIGRLRRGRQRAGGLGGLAQRARKIGNVVERDGEVQMSERERRIDLQRLAERR